MLKNIFFFFIPFFFIPTQSQAQKNILLDFELAYHLEMYHKIEFFFGQLFLPSTTEQQAIAAPTIRIVLLEKKYCNTDLLSKVIPFMVYPLGRAILTQVGDQSFLPKEENRSPNKEKKEGSFILAIFGMMHWFFIGIIIMGVLWASITSFFIEKK